jgi:hypothetical protein
MAMSMKVNGSKLIIEVDIDAKALKAAPLSKSGKTRLVASTGGFTNVEGLNNVKVNLSVTTAKE